MKIYTKEEIFACLVTCDKFIRENSYKAKNGKITVIAVTSLMRMYTLNRLTSGEGIKLYSEVYLAHSTL